MDGKTEKSTTKLNKMKKEETKEGAKPVDSKKLDVVKQNQNGTAEAVENIRPNDAGGETEQKSLIVNLKSLSKNPKMRVWKSNLNRNKVTNKLEDSSSSSIESTDFSSRTFSSTTSSGSLMDTPDSSESDNGQERAKTNYPRRLKKVLRKKPAQKPIKKPVVVVVVQRKKPRRIKKPAVVAEGNELTEKVQLAWDWGGKYLVDTILDTRVEADGTRSYLIKWKRHAGQRNTWEPADSISSDFVTRFEKMTMAENKNPKPEESTEGTPNGKSTKYDEGNQTIIPVTNLAGRRVRTIRAMTQYRKKMFFIVGFVGEDPDCYSVVKGEDMKAIFPQEVISFYEERMFLAPLEDLFVDNNIQMDSE